MAKASEVQLGSVWCDRAGAQFHVIEPLGPDRKFGVMNLITRQPTRKGPRSLLRQIQPAPTAHRVPAPPPGPGAPMWGPHGGYLRQPAPMHVGYEEEEEEFEEPAPFAPQQVAGYEPFPDPVTGQTLYRRPAPGQPPQAPAHSPGPQRAPSALVAAVVQHLLSLHPSRAESPAMVGQETARAIANYRQQQLSAGPPPGFPRRPY